MEADQHVEPHTLTMLEALLQRYPKQVRLPDGTAVVLRPLAPADADKLVALFSDVAEEELRILRDDVTDPHVVRRWATDVNYERVLPVVAEADGRLIADATLHRRPVNPYEKVGKVRLYVHPAYRRRGLGDRLLREMLDLARGLGLERVLMEFYVDHAPLIAAFERRGFVREAILPTYQMVVLAYDVRSGVAPTAQPAPSKSTRNLPPVSLWPEQVYLLDDFRAYPASLNVCELLLDRQLEAGRGERPALYAGTGSMTYAALHDEVVRLAGGLSELGVGPGDRVLIYMPNVPGAVVTHLAVQRLGGISVPVPPQLSRRELCAVLRDADVACAVTTAELLPELLVARKAAPCPHVVALGCASDEAHHVYSFADVLAGGTPTFSPVRRPREAPALILYTYRGDEGHPKGTVHRNEASLIVADVLGKHVWHMNEEDVIVTLTPLGLLQGYVAVGVLPYRFGAAAALVPYMTIRALLETVRRWPVTITLLTPTVYRHLLAEHVPPETFHHVRLCLASGESLTERTYQAWLERVGLPILENFGTTEMLCFFLSNAVPAVPKPGSLGRPVPGYDVKVVDDEGREVRTGEIGHLVVRGPTGTFYWNDPDTQRAVVRHGWNSAGDYVYCDRQGYFWFVAREDDVIKRGGYRIDPAEVETALREHPVVADAAVVGLPDPLAGQRVHAFLVPKPGVQPDERLAAEILESLHGRLAGYKIPSTASFVEALPRSSRGHLLRRRLRERMRRRSWASN
ncbi:MAG: GNAT family N-acetyltransferase [Ardenticatenia bacterium]|nr:GNAT family N-acetyltransferase [Ardenticatenia bacterium]